MFTLQFIFLYISVTYVTSVSFTVPIHRPKINKTLQLVENGKGTQDLTSYETYYVGPVKVGTPPKEFILQFDTGSGTTWIAEENCTVGEQNIPCSNNHTYINIHNSHSAQDTGYNFSCQYGSGFSSGRLVRDNISIGSNEKFGEVNLEFGLHNFDPIMNMINADGILGLSFKNNEFFYTPQSIVDVWAEEGTLDDDVFTVWLDKNATQKGEIAFGSTLPEKCGDVIVKAGAKLFAGTWNFEVDSVKMDNITLGTNLFAISDTGCTQLLVPSHWDIAMLLDGNIDVVSQHNLTFTIGGHDFVMQGKDLYQGINPVLIEKPNQVSIVFGDTFLRQFCSMHYVKTKEVGFAVNKTPPS